MSRVDLNGLARLQARLGTLALRGAEAAAGVARDKLSGPGSGRLYAGQPQRSSAPGEYSATQTGAHRASLGHRPDGPARAVFGFLDPPAHSHALHFKPPGDGGRPDLDHLLEDPDVQRAVKEAMGVK